MVFGQSADFAAVLLYSPLERVRVLSNRPLAQIELGLWPTLAEQLPILWLDAHDVRLVGPPLG